MFAHPMVFQVTFEIYELAGQGWEGHQNLWLYYGLVLLTLFSYHWETNDENKRFFKIDIYRLHDGLFLMLQSLFIVEFRDGVLNRFSF